MSCRAEVGIVGLGLAGLRAACLLEDAGVTVALFEAGAGAGGRLRTEEPEDGVAYEAGAEWIDADHERMLALAAALGLELVPAAPEEAAVALHRGERRSLAALREDARWDAAAVEAAAEAFCEQLGAPPWSSGLARDLDRRTLAEFLDETLRTESGRVWVPMLYRSDEGEELDRVGLLGWLHGFTHYLGRRGHEAGAYRLARGGSDLAKTMLGGLRAEPRFGSTLRAVGQGSAGVTLHFDDGFTAEVDHAVLALPAACLRDVAFDPPPDARRAAALRSCGVGRGMKLALRFEEPWWRACGSSGQMVGDGVLQDVWCVAAGEAAVLCVYVSGDAAAALSREPDPAARAVSELARYFPEAARSYRRGWVHNWTADPRARGVHSYFPPGYVSNHHPNIARPEGRVHFAGEYTSSWNGFLEGALESAERVRSELLSVRVARPERASA